MTPETSNNANLGLTWNVKNFLNPAKLQIRPTASVAQKSIACHSKFFSYSVIQTEKNGWTPDLSKCIYEDLLVLISQFPFQGLDLHSSLFNRINTDDTSILYCHSSKKISYSNFLCKPLENTSHAIFWYWYSSAFLWLLSLIFQQY